MMRKSARLVCAVLVFVLVIGTLAGLAGIIRGVEFSPRSWERRRFSMFELPLIGWRVGPALYRQLPDDLITYLSTQSWWPGGSSEGDLFVVMSAGGRGRSWTGDAEIMSEFLGVDPREGPSVWLGWSREHPDLARVLWPEVFHVVQEGRYDVVPDLFQAALGSWSPEALGVRLVDIRSERL